MPRFLRDLYQRVFYPGHMSEDWLNARDKKDDGRNSFHGVNWIWPIRKDKDETTSVPR